jgi:DNA-damage-inducible protein D
MGKREESNKLAIFEGEEIRRTIIEGEWYYSLVDIIRVLTDSNNPRRY